MSYCPVGLVLPLHYSAIVEKWQPFYTKGGDFHHENFNKQYSGAIFWGNPCFEWHYSTAFIIGWQPFWTPPTIADTGTTSHASISEKCSRYSNVYLYQFWCFFIKKWTIGWVCRCTIGDSKFTSTSDSAPGPILTLIPNADTDTDTKCWYWYWYQMLILILMLILTPQTVTRLLSCSPCCTSSTSTSGVPDQSSAAISWMLKWQLDSSPPSPAWTHANTRKQSALWGLGRTISPEMVILLLVYV